ncbi:unnamed protein product [Acanthoscelides obtectus]|uniref:Uncharacterized protein n=1 Tax=Acanthoscelides obtectus TaxID=200917 RepID=A0A9P0JX79_ACAOB|nr:unnamed protein product [Acanthoscelides obtectus]CAK1638134.1 hypothetical protein AOBTE_LOCUS10403 [Acanthoscelides obtectus]
MLFLAWRWSSIYRNYICLVIPEIAPSSNNYIQQYFTPYHMSEEEIRTKEAWIWKLLRLCFCCYLENTGPSLDSSASFLISQSTKLSIKISGVTF